MIVLRDAVSELLFGNPHEQTVVVLIAVGIPALNTWRYVSEVMRVRMQAFHYLATTFIAAVLSTVLTVVGILALGWRVNGALVAGLIGNWVAAVYGLAFVAASISGRFSRFQLTADARVRPPARPRGARRLGARADRPGHPVAARQRRGGRPVRGREPAREPPPDRSDRVPVRAHAVPAGHVLRGSRRRRRRPARGR